MARRMWQTRNLRILVDMDQVLCNFEKRFLELYRKKYPHAAYVEVESRNTFYVEDQYSLMDEDLREYVRSVLFSKGFFLGMEPIAGAIDAMKEMSSMEGLDIFICTACLSSNPHGLAEKHKWVEKHLGKHWSRRLIFTYDKTMVNGDILIDDKPSIKGSVKPPTWLHVLFTSPGNADKKLEESQVRLDGWSDYSIWKSIIEDAKKKL